MLEIDHNMKMRVILKPETANPFLVAALLFKQAASTAIKNIIVEGLY